MNNQPVIQIFESKEKRQWFIDDNDILWLHGTLLCKKLGYKNPAEAIMMHTDINERQKPESLSAMPSPPWFVSESGAWALILNARTAEAKEFRRYLSTEVLPAIRRDGAYISPDITKPQAIAAREKLDRILDTPCPWTRMYTKEACTKAFQWYGANFYWLYAYSWMTPEERCKLNRVNPVVNGDRNHRIHQDIEKETRDRLTPQMTRLVDFLISSTSKQDFETRMGRVFGTDQIELEV
jgi:prophage antirepressor-like protein